MLGVAVRELAGVPGVFEFPDGRPVLDENERIILCPLQGAEDEPPERQRQWLRREFDETASGFAQVLGPPSDSFSWGPDAWMCWIWRGTYAVLSVEESFYDDSYGAPGIVVACVGTDDETPTRREGLTARLFRERRAPRAIDPKR